jgi:hypothetical protein
MRSRQGFSSFLPSFLPGKCQTPSPARIWDLFRTTSAPLGYDPASFWPGCWSDPRFALLGLDPTMIEVTAMAMMSRPRLRWRTGTVPKLGASPGSGFTVPVRRQTSRDRPLLLPG